jgi:hypothetical protein
MTKRLTIALLLLICAATAFAKANIIIVNNDSAGKGLNDPTPVAPVGLNSGTTLGQQRLNAFQTAATIWGNLLNSNVDIRVNASFTDQQCDATSAVLGSARAASYVNNFTNAPLANIWYPVALADALANKDFTNGGPHIIAQFNSALDGRMSCLGGISWYYGLDTNHGNNEDLVVVLLHEFGHGLGFVGAVDTSTGRFRIGSSAFPSVFDLHVFDETAGLHFDQMSDAQRLAAITDTGKLVWDGSSVRGAVPTTLGPTPFINVTAAGTTTTYPVATATFGSAVTVAGINGNIVAAQDPSDMAGASTTDGCSALTNASAIIGKIALIDRGNCNFTVKVKNAQNAGAIAVIIANNVFEATPHAMGGTDTTITIPAVGVTQDDGNKIRAALAGTVSARIFADTTKLAGTSSTGNNAVLLYAPGTVESGSTLYHWDTSAFPNLLMEPNVSADLTHGVDLTLNELIDIGWSTTLNSVFPGRRILKRGH